MIIRKLIKITFIILTVVTILQSCQKNEINQVSISENALAFSEKSIVNTKGIGEEEEADPIVQLNGTIIDGNSATVGNQVIDLVLPQDSSIVSTETSNQYGNFQMNVPTGVYRFGLNTSENNRIYTNIFQLQDSVQSILVVID